MRRIQIVKSVIWKLVFAVSILCAPRNRVHAEDQITAIPGSSTAEAQDAAEATVDDSPDDVLPPEEWQRVDAAVDRGLRWLASQQNPDGSFPTLDRGQPAVTGFCVLAFMAHGHLPGEGEHGQRLDQATDFIVSCQKQNGLVTLLGPEGPRLTAEGVPIPIGEPAAYNHAISSLALAEVYGMSQTKDSKALQEAITKAIAATLELQRRPTDLPADRGGWRYITDDGVHDSDLSMTGWQLMFLRSARNAGFNVPQQPIDDAVKYVRRTYHPHLGRFGYLTGERTHASRGMAGAGILALAHAGFHNSREAQSAGQWLLRHNFDTYNGGGVHWADRYHYSLFNVTQAMYQLGGSYWKEFFPSTVEALLANQRPDGSWDAERLQRDRAFGNAYTTALVVLSLGAPNQFLPIFQR
jgi:hypothetical protein